MANMIVSSKEVADSWNKDIEKAAQEMSKEFGMPIKEARLIVQDAANGVLTEMADELFYGGK